MTFYQGKVCQKLNFSLSTYCECLYFLLLKVTDIYQCFKLLFVMTQSAAINKEVLAHSINL